MGYHYEAEWLAYSDWGFAFQYWGSLSGVSDIGYVFYLTTLYKIYGSNIIITRLIKAFLSAYTCVLVYRLSRRTFGERTGRLAAIFSMLMPNLIIYCGLHLKETEMLFCVMMFLERTDFLLRSNQHSFKNILVPSLFALSLFYFRTVLGVIAIISFFVAIKFSPTFVSSDRKVSLYLWIVIFLAIFASGTILHEVEGYWKARVIAQDLKRQEQTSRGARWAKYATGTVMAPMAFVVPFSTMIDTGQENQNVMHSGNFIKNFLGIFSLFALYYTIKSKRFRNFSLIGTFTVLYLGVVSFSGFANAERFHLPALPCILMISAYGLSFLNARNYKYVDYWFIVVVLMEVSWAYFKLGSRGIA
ncbi:MAG: hypothetical protein MJ002_05445 [Paludibacteraceae bacterium]|nr:hypothetical protein [Paludibacteraceae bacterium]